MTAPVIIEILYFDGCPNHDPLLAQLPRLLQRHRIVGEIVARNIPDADTAQRERSLGSPSIRVDGRDIEPGADDRRDYGLKCRIYHTATGLAGLPPDEWILDAMAGPPVASNAIRPVDKGVAHAPYVADEPVTVDLEPSAKPRGVAYLKRG